MAGLLGLRDSGTHSCEGVRIKHEQFGDCKSVDSGLYELRLFFGPGYRVYFGEHLGKTILILAGGDKSSQSRDIKRAKEYWKTYLEDNT